MRKPIFQAGGTLAPHAVYVKRPQDDQFIDCLSRPETWINVYGCRTMGKSSLYARHREDLPEDQRGMIIVDVASDIVPASQTAIGWVRGLGEAISARMGTEAAILMRSLKGSRDKIGPGIALERVLIDGLLELRQSQTILILDEYDYLSTLPYAEDLLYGFRSLQASQARASGSPQLSICFVGLLPITELGQLGAASTSPFSVPIEMLDFEVTGDTIATLVSGLPSEWHPSAEAIRTALVLSGCQPLITMEVLNQLRQKRDVTPDGVQRIGDRLVAPSGLGADLQVFAQMERFLLNAGSQAFSALRTYELLLQGSREAQGSPGGELLLLSGIVRRKSGNLEIKGRLFERRFDKAWVERMLSRAASGMARGRTMSEHPVAETYARRFGSSTSQQSTSANKTYRKRKAICIISLGGNLVMVRRRNNVAPVSDAAEFKRQFPLLDRVAEIEFVNFLNLDAINMFPSEWSTLARYIYERRHDGFEGFVVIHGTDTMAYTASAVAFALGPQLNFPVVFTGSQTMPEIAHGDAHINLYQACEVAKARIPEVVISFCGSVFRAVRAQKRDDDRFDAFESPTYPRLAEIREQVYVNRALLRVQGEGKDIELRNNFDASILIVPQFPGLQPEFLESILTDGRQTVACDGIILQTLGSGTVTSRAPFSLIPFIARAHRLGIPVITTSQRIGQEIKEYDAALAPILAGAIHVGNMSTPATVSKFRWVLADLTRRPTWPGVSPEERHRLVRDLMIETSFVGEFDAA